MERRRGWYKVEIVYSSNDLNAVLLVDHISDSRSLSSWGLVSTILFSLCLGNLLSLTRFLFLTKIRIEVHPFQLLDWATCMGNQRNRHTPLYSSSVRHPGYQYRKTACATANASLLTIARALVLSAEVFKSPYFGHYSNPSMYSLLRVVPVQLNPQEGKE